jgi:hypothetical protein
VPTFGADRERVTVFRVGDEFFFSYYFDRQDVFEELRDYYDDDHYRFAVPADEFDAVRDVLADAFYEPVVVEDLEPYCVVIEQYEKHAEILRQSVATWERDGHRFFLLKDDLAVREAVERGATRVEETSFVVGI